MLISHGLLNCVSPYAVCCYCKKILRFHRQPLMFTIQLAAFPIEFCLCDILPCQIRCRNLDGQWPQQIRLFANMD